MQNTAATFPADLTPSSLSVDAARIAHYARLTDDYNPIHTDPAFAATTPMGGIIAHGMLSMNLIWQALAVSLGPDCCEGVTLEIRFTRPVRPGDTVTAGGRRIVGATPPAYEVWVTDQTGTPVIAGTAYLAAGAQAGPA